MIDIGHFKHVNDTDGHDGGKAVLAVLMKRLRDIDTHTRLGGGEFVLLSPAAPEPEPCWWASGCGRPWRCLLVRVGAQAVDVTTSFGMAIESAG